MNSWIKSDPGNSISGVNCSYGSPRNSICAIKLVNK
jgi:hypothetical protein